MAQIKISALTTGTPKGTDLTPATDTTDTTQAASGTTKKYTRSSELNYYMAALGYTTITATLVATTAALTVVYANGALGVGATLTNAGAQAALSIDGVTLAASDRVLVKNQAAPAQNGIYTVTTVGSGATNWVMTRATDYDQAADINENDFILVDSGTTNGGVAFIETAPGPFTIGTTSITFSTFNFSSSTFAWNVITATSAPMISSTGYFSDNAGVVTLTLPVASIIGDEIKIAGLGVGGWLIAQGAGQYINIGTSTSTIGAGGSVASTYQRDSITLVCTADNLGWMAVGAPQSAGLTIV